MLRLGRVLVALTQHTFFSRCLCRTQLALKTATVPRRFPPCSRKIVRNALKYVCTAEEDAQKSSQPAGLVLGRQTLLRFSLEHVVYVKRTIQRRQKPYHRSVVSRPNHSTDQMRPIAANAMKRRGLSACVSVRFLVFCRVRAAAAAGDAAWWSRTHVRWVRSAAAARRASGSSTSAMNI